MTDKSLRRQSADPRVVDGQPNVPPSVARILMTEEAVYGLILVSGMIVVSGTVVGTSINALVTVVVTVLVFYLAHVYAGTLARLAMSDGHAGLRASMGASARHFAGMLVAAVPPLGILLLGTTEVIDDTTSIWTALIVDTVILGVLGWIAVARWSTHWVPRLISAVVTAGFGAVLVALKAVIHH